ncbi:MAG: hypothetical protein KBG91_01120 [Syntrophomonadaceae bacterium]|nr:hypothetical protein [Syntrophomonadaceae bacterium]HRX22337.1 hypothetical protein [Syntrophomonadaceae bacterium]
MEIKKQVPNITVNIRVPAPVFEKLEQAIRVRKDNGMRISKNSLYVDALEKYLDNLEQNEQIQPGIRNEF